MGVKHSRVILEKCQGLTIGVCPSVSYLFNSLYSIHAKDTIAMLLTGMGKDGADELKALRNGGAITIAQDEQSSLVHGMPGTAIRMNAAKYICSPVEIAGILNNIESNAQDQVAQRLTSKTSFRD
jgi:two-component system chemotaxis response regulator CheB